MVSQNTAGVFVPTGKPELYTKKLGLEHEPNKAKLDTSGKNLLLGRYRFRYDGACYEVSQEVYPDAYIQLPLPKPFVLAVGEWDKYDRNAHQITHVHRVARPDDRPRVWATYASDFICFEHTGQTYKIDRLAADHHLPILLPDGRWIKPKGWIRSPLYKPQPVDIERCTPPNEDHPYCEATLVETCKPE
jgi:hypothetical protein